MGKKLTYNEIDELLNDEENFDELFNTMENSSEKEIFMILDVIRDKRLKGLFDDLNIDEEKLKEALEKEIELSPKSVEYPLFSTLYRDHDGKYKVKDLINEYHDSIIREGAMIGIQYGKKFIVEDFQNKKITLNQLQKMSSDEITEYISQVREDI